VSLVDAIYAAARWGWYLAVFLVVGAGSYAPFFFRAHGLRETHPGVVADLTRRAAGVGFGAPRVMVFSLLRFCSRPVLNDRGPLTTNPGRILGTRWEGLGRR
jgi:hypothetical protein